MCIQWEYGLRPLFNLRRTTPLDGHVRWPWYIPKENTELIFSATSWFHKRLYRLVWIIFAWGMHLSKQSQGGERETALHLSFYLMQFLRVGIETCSSSSVRSNHAYFTNSTRSCCKQIHQTLVDASKMTALLKFVGNMFINRFGGTHCGVAEVLRRIFAMVQLQAD